MMAEHCEFSNRDQGLALLPVVPLQAKCICPNSVVKRLAEQHYVISNPNCRKVIQPCHVNLLKPYYFHVVSESTEPCIGDFGVQINPAFWRVMGQVPTLCGREDTCGLDDVLVWHTSVPKYSELVDLIKKYPSLFENLSNVIMKHIFLKTHCSVH